MIQNGSLFIVYDFTSARLDKSLLSSTLNSYTGTTFLHISSGTDTLTRFFHTQIVLICNPNQYVPTLIIKNRNRNRYYETDETLIHFVTNYTRPQAMNRQCSWSVWWRWHLRRQHWHRIKKDNSSNSTVTKSTFPFLGTCDKIQIHTVTNYTRPLAMSRHVRSY